MHVSLNIFSFLQFARQYKIQHPFGALFRRLIQKSLLRTGNSSKIVEEIELVTFKVHSPLRQDESGSNDRPTNTQSTKGKQAIDLNESTNIADLAFLLSGNEGHSIADGIQESSSSIVLEHGPLVISSPYNIVPAAINIADVSTALPHDEASCLNRLPDFLIKCKQHDDCADGGVLASTPVKLNHSSTEVEHCQQQESAEQIQLDGQPLSEDIDMGAYFDKLNISEISHNVVAGFTKESIEF